MEEKLTIRLSNNIGNQMFMFAAGYAASKIMRRNFYYDNLSSYKARKNIYTYALHGFEIPNYIKPSEEVFLNLNGYLKRKIKKKLDYFFKKKSFILEKYTNNKETEFNPINLNRKYRNKIFMEGYFESEKYFSNYRKDLLNFFIPKKKNLFEKNNYFKQMLSNQSVSICLRQNRFNEKFGSISNKDYEKSKSFLDEQIKFLFESIRYFKKKIKSPTFYLWSNSFHNLKDIFNSEDIIFVDNSKVVDKIDKIHLDLYLMTKCRHFAVIPSAFNWWGAWLSNYKDKHVIRPKDNYFKHLQIKNKDYWPKDWISL